MRKTFVSGNIAVAEGAITAGVKLYAGYPITPSTEIFEYLAEKLPAVGGAVLQMEDELGAINSIIGASWAGVKAMTATSGPGFSLMAEGIGLAVITETPIVIVNVMRTGPSTGIPTKSSQSDILQARWMAHGDYIVPSYAPWNVQEAYDLTIKAFNTSELLRNPVMLLSDAVLAHLWEPLTLYEQGEVEVINRKTPAKGSKVLPYKLDPDLVPPMPVFGQGFKTIFESATHDEHGFYTPTNSAQRELTKRLVNKVLRRIDYISEQETTFCEDADVVLASFGSAARTVNVIVHNIRRKNVKAGFLRLKTLWPLHEERIKSSCRRAKKVIVVENNMGKLYMDFERILKDKDVYSAPIINIDLSTPKEVLEVVEQWL
ncbi:MAG: 2-oxoacid:acceptor oxidoreductase subunit alpha [Desulfurococcaceae archaeon]